MFTGLIEAKSNLVSFEKNENEQLCRIVVETPKIFDDVFSGHSIATNGVCLTLVEDPTDVMKFDLGAETLRLTSFKNLEKGQTFNLERPLKMGDRLHGHLVTGHVDEISYLTKRTELDGGCLELEVSFTEKEYIWAKGSVVLNGVSLTINTVKDDKLSVCLIPETLKKTNLISLKVGDELNLEYDFWAKGIMHHQKFGSDKTWSKDSNG